MGFSSTLSVDGSDQDLITSGKQFFPGDSLDVEFSATPTGEENYITDVAITSFKLFVFDSSGTKIGTITIDPAELAYTSGDTDNDGLMETGETWNYQASYKIPSDFLSDYPDASYLRFQATIEGRDSDNVALQDPTLNEKSTPASAANEIFIIAPNPELQLTKEADLTSYEGPGEEITYTFTVENTGNVDLEDLQIEDAQLDDPATYVSGDDGDGIFETDETWVFTGTYTTTAEDDGDILNTATATASYGEEDVNDSDDEIVEYDPANPSLDLVKSADKTSFSAAGELITYTFEVTNTGNRDLDDLTLDDPLLSNETPVESVGYNVGDVDEDDVFDIGETWEFTGTYNATSNDVSNGEIVNKATAKANYTYAGGQTETLTAEDNWIVYLAPEGPFEGLSQGYWGQHFDGSNPDPTWDEKSGVGDKTYRETSFEEFFFGSQIGDLIWDTKISGGAGSSAKGSKKGVVVTGDGDDLLFTDAVNATGGGKYALARDAVAAVMNAERDDINYEYSVSWIQGAVRDAFNINDGGANNWTISSLQAELNHNNSLGLN